MPVILAFAIIGFDLAAYRALGSWVLLIIAAEIIAAFIGYMTGRFI